MSKREVNPDDFTEKELLAKIVKNTWETAYNTNVIRKYVILVFWLSVIGALILLMTS